MGNFKIDYLNELVSIILRIANYADRHGEAGDFTFTNELGLGYKALSGYLRRGAKEMIDIQERYSVAVMNEDLAKTSEQEMRKFLTEMFGVEEPETLSDELKAKLKDFVKKLLDDEESNDERVDQR